MFQQFPWLAALGGGVFIGLSASLLFALNGRVAGISGILGALFTPKPGDTGWRLAFLGGLLGGGVVALVLWPAQYGGSPAPLWLLGVAGLFVGFGTRLGSGCTSGHGVCGLSRLSPRSLVATLTFMATGVVGVIIGKLIGGAA